MGWNCKHDKQIAKALGLVLCVCGVSGCSLFSSPTTKYVSMSNSTNYIIGGENTGGITGDKSRAVIVDDEENSETIDEINFIPELFSDNKFMIREFHDDSFIENFNSSARAVAVNANVASGTNKLQEDNSFYYVKDTSPSSGRYTYGQCTATLKVTGTHCRVYTYDTDSILNDTVYQTIADKFDSIYDIETNICGKNYLSSYYDEGMITPDSSTLIDILIYDIDGDTTNPFSEGGTVGYFYMADFSTTEYFENSNEREMFYVDSYWLSYYPEEVYTTLVHEFNHMLNFVNKYCKYGTLTYVNQNWVPYSNWFTEMLAMSTEDILQSELGIADTYAPRQRLNLFNYYSNLGFLKDSYWESSSSYIYYSYANAYAFGAYLIRNYGGAKLLNEIATNSYIDEAAITNALKTCGYSKTFEDVFSEFAEVLINYDGSNNELCTLNKSLSTTLGNYSYSLSKINLNEFYLYSDSSYTTKYYGPYFYASDDTDFDLCPGGIIVKILTAKDNWTIEKKIKNQNSYLTYKLY